MFNFWDFLSVPPLAERQPLTGTSFTQFLLPAVLCYYATAVFVLLPRTLLIRFALLPISLVALFYAFTVGMRVTIWAFKTKPLKRRPVNAPKDENPSLTSFKQTFTDAMDLCFNLRGIGWDWSRGLKIPEETRDITSRSTFLWSTLWWTVRDTFFFDLSHYVLQWFSPTTLGSPVGGTIFDESLPAVQRYARSTIITLLFGFVGYWMIDCLYHTSTLIGVLIFRQDPSQWPPLSNKPYLARSLNEFWTFRWHQSFRDCFIHIGSNPFYIIFGKYGAILGAFVVSGILHDLGCWAMGRGTEPMRVSGFFIMSGIGCILEILFKTYTGKRVGGALGTIWAMTWLLLWGSRLVDAWALRGFIGSEFIETPFRPSTWLFGRLPSP
ncbi:membrane bound O-acyl transferase family-domain-containing protein [Crepidotus variabilis]|uniref:Membrane bound O-acyl transferase family-domain-containing protein n=1 Tax=Crepidotus variabilis TaxID=179855 RepID=A0A9P6E8U1_9AGAR|nr:membrane bound O-acyl transferase family-domain-containing protein [Crepidotus variabilis]